MMKYLAGASKDKHVAEQCAEEAAKLYKATLTTEPNEQHPKENACESK
jgi:hypothetical protein